MRRLWNYDADWREHRDDPRWVNPNKQHSKTEYPYAFSGYFIYGNREVIKQEGVTGLYSDRLEQ